jgi:hypothetical protein
VYLTCKKELTKRFLFAFSAGIRLVIQ